MHNRRICPSLRSVLVLLVAVVPLTVAPLGLAMSRLAARSDEADALALARWLATSNQGEQAATSAHAIDPLPFKRPRGARRATG